MFSYVLEHLWLLFDSVTTITTSVSTSRCTITSVDHGRQTLSFWPRRSAECLSLSFRRYLLSSGLAHWLLSTPHLWKSSRLKWNRMSDELRLWLIGQGRRTGIGGRWRGFTRRRPLFVSLVYHVPCFRTYHLVSCSPRRLLSFHITLFSTLCISMTPTWS